MQASITVLLATYNGADTLPITLESLCRLDSAGLDWRIVAVDNGSTDATAAILRSFEGRLPLTCLHEPRRGKNIALNAALPHVRQGLVVLIDDDVVPRPDFLRVIQAFFAAHPDVTVMGGRIEPMWTSAIPRWLDAVPMDVTYASTAPQTEDGPVAPQLIWGANMTVRSAIFAAGFRFDGRVGPDGTAFYAMGSETEFTARVAAQGHATWHCSAAVVQHIIPAEQMTRRYVCLRAFRFGRGQTRRQARDAAPQAPSVFGVPRYILGQIVYALGACATATARRDSPGQVGALWKIAYWAGVARELRSRRHAASA